MSEKKDILNKIIQSSNSSLTDKEIEDSVLEPLLEEIELIRDHSISSFVRSLLLRSKEFWKIPGSFASVYHPPDEDNDFGNVLHTKRVVRVALIMCANLVYSNIETDIIIAACILHDLTKGVEAEDGKFDYDEFHPYTIDNFYQTVKRQDLLNSETQSTVLHLDDQTIGKILRLVHCHEGADSKIPETRPLVEEEMIVANANSIASRLHWIIDGDSIIMDRWLL